MKYTLIAMVVFGCLLFDWFWKTMMAEQVFDHEDEHRKQDDWEDEKEL